MTGTSVQEGTTLNSSFYQDGVIFENTTALIRRENEDQDSAFHRNILTGGWKAILIIELWLDICVIIFKLMKVFQQARVRVPCSWIV